MKVNIEGRLFIVGCPRSGTTLVQSFLAAHPKINSFPESHFFANTYRHPLLNKLGMVSPGSKTKFQEWLIDIEEEKSLHLLSGISIFHKNYTDKFVSILDMLTIKKNKNIWTEKTPRHLHYIDIIEKYVPDAKFIHVVRKGEDVVASLYDVTHKYPGIWGGRRGLDQCVNRWNNDVSITEKYLNKENHLVINFQEVLDNTELCLKKICAFLDVEFDESMLTEQSSASDELILDREEWKESVKSGLKKPEKKYEVLFDENQKEYIRNHLFSLDAELYID
jgi:hypothetical protein